MRDREKLLLPNYYYGPYFSPLYGSVLRMKSTLLFYKLVEYNNLCRFSLGLKGCIVICYNVLNIFITIYQLVLHNSPDFII